MWYKDIHKHRLDGPAVIHPNGTRFWFFLGNLHCENGPAIIYPDGKKEYYLDGNLLEKEWYQKYQKLKQKHTLNGVPVRDRWAIREIVLSWYYDPRLGCVQKRLKRQFESLH